MEIEKEQNPDPVEMKITLDGLQFAQALYPTEYKLIRIIQLRKRLGIDKE